MQQTNTSVGTTSAAILDYSTIGSKIRYMLIQNTHASQNLFVRLDGATATTANGIKIEAGQAMEIHLPKDMPINNDVTAIASGASTTVIIAYAV